MPQYYVNTRIYTKTYVIDAPDEETAVRAYERLIETERVNLDEQDSEIDIDEFVGLSRPIDFIASEVLGEK